MFALCMSAFKSFPKKLTGRDLYKPWFLDWNNFMEKFEVGLVRPHTVPPMLRYFNYTSTTATVGIPWYSIDEVRNMCPRDEAVGPRNEMRRKDTL